MLLCTEQLFPTLYHTELERHKESLKILHSLLAFHTDLEKHPFKDVFGANGIMSESKSLEPAYSSSNHGQNTNVDRSRSLNRFKDFLKL